MGEAVPVVGPPRPLRPPRVAEGTLRNGLRVLAVRKATVPRVELRLLTPVTGTRNAAAERVLAKTLTSGTTSRSSVEIAEELQRLGATFGAGVGADHFQVSGSVLASNFEAFLELTAELLTDSTFPADEVTLERQRVVQEVQIARSQPQTVATEVMRRRLFGRHPYGTLLPETDAVGRVGRAPLTRLVTERISSRGGVLVIVGDIGPQAAIELVDAALSKWRARRGTDASRAPRQITSGPTLVVDRPGAVQTNIRIAGPAPALCSDESFAADLANTIYGGYFISRLVDNIRERNGYTYTPGSHLVHMQHADYFEAVADVGAEVTAPALVETRYELSRMASKDVDETELEAAKRYRVGTQALRVQSQAGLAGVLAALVVHGLDIDYLRTYPKRITALSAADVRAASLAYLAPRGLVTVLVGDAERIRRDIEAFDETRLVTS
jgi:predicted Zn-dependent peptidase